MADNNRHGKKASFTRWKLAGGPLGGWLGTVGGAAQPGDESDAVGRADAVIVS